MDYLENLVPDLAERPAEEEWFEFKGNWLLVSLDKVLEYIRLTSPDIQVHLGSCVGLVVDGDCKVLDASDKPIENLFATGECCIGGNVFDLHVGGWGIGGACYSGRIAGETAKAELLA